MKTYFDIVVTLVCSGKVLVRVFECPEADSYGLTKMPDRLYLMKKIPSRYWPAIARAHFAYDTYGGPTPVLQMDLVSTKGKPLGTIFAEQLTKEKA
jgi:hypothetical protein